MRQICGHVLINRMKIHNANAISGPLSYGFPAITGFLGAVHAVSRKIAHLNLHLGGVLIASHKTDLKVYRPHKYSDYSFNQSRNPILKSGKTASIVQEGKMNLTVSLAIEVYAEEELSRQQKEELIENLYRLFMQHRMAGGSVHGLHHKEPIKYFDSNRVDEIKANLAPGFVLMDAHKELSELTLELRKIKPEATALDALIDTSTLHHIPQQENNKIKWTNQSSKTGRGWLVPLPVGFQGIEKLFEPGELGSCRNPEYHSQYVEALYSLGKWVFAYRLNDMENAFWRHQYKPENNLYLITQHKK